MNLKDLQATRFWQYASKKTQDFYPNASKDQQVQATIRTMIELQVSDIIEQAKIRLTKYQPKSVNDIMNAPERIRF